MKARRYNLPTIQVRDVYSTYHLNEEDFIDQTIQNDVPTLKEILTRYQLTGEVIGVKSHALSFSESDENDVDTLHPDVETLNQFYQKYHSASANSFAETNESDEVQKASKASASKSLDNQDNINKSSEASNSITDGDKL